MKNKLFQLNCRLAALAIFMTLCFLTGTVLTIQAQCTPVGYQKSFQKVFRQQKIFFEGTADLTGDGKPDAYGYQVIGNSYKNLVVVPNDGNGGFGEPLIINTASNISTTAKPYKFTNVVVGDVNLDGKLDMVVHLQTTPVAIQTFYNNGNGSFTASNPTLLASNERVFQIADINIDGRADLVTVNTATFTNTVNITGISYRIGNSDGTFGSAVNLYTADSINLRLTLVLGDFNNDGKADIAYTFYFNSPTTGTAISYRILTNVGGGVFAAGTPVPAPTDFDAVADLNNDGKLDILGNTIFINNGDNTFTSNSLGYIHPVPVDFDGDGDKDILSTLSYGTSVIYKLYLNNGQGIFTESTVRKTSYGLPVDMNGDGKSEQIVFVNSSIGANLPNPANEAAIFVKEAVCVRSFAGQPKLLDFQGDEVSDPAMWNQNSGLWRYFNFEAINAWSFGWGNGSYGDIAAPGDFDGDGKTDAAVYRNSTGAWYVLQSGDGSVYALTFGLPGDIPIPGDYDGDGKSDIAVFRPSTGDWHIWLTGTQQYRGIHWGIAEDKPLPADYDGDGKTDVAVFRPSTGYWYYQKSSDNDFGAVNWGIATDIPVPADFDMDGKADLTVFRPSSGIWYSRRSFDGNLASLQFGQSGDIPMAVDSNGDGALEFAAFRPGLNAWLTIAQPSSIWFYFGSSQEKPLRIGLPNN